MSPPKLPVDGPPIYQDLAPHQLDSSPRAPYLEVTATLYCPFY